MDDGAQNIVAGLGAYKRYWVHTNNLVAVKKSNERFKFGNGISEGLRTAKIRVPIDYVGKFLQ